MIISRAAKDKAEQLFHNLASTFDNTMYDSINHNIKLAPGQSQEEGFEGTFNRHLQQSQE